MVKVIGATAVEIVDIESVSLKKALYRGATRFWHVDIQHGAIRLSEDGHQ